MYPIQFLNYAVAVAAWLLAFASIREKEGIRSGLAPGRRSILLRLHLSLPHSWSFLQSDSSPYGGHAMAVR